MRAQLEVVHGWSVERGQQLLAISGIPGYYRRFGYELALQQGGGGVLHTSSIPRPDPDEAHAFRVRALTTADVPFVTRTYASGTRDALVTVPRDDALWRHEWQGRSELSGVRQEFHVIETRGGEPVGFLTHQPSAHGPVFEVTEWKMAPGVSWGAAWPAFLAHCWTTGES